MTQTNTCGVDNIEDETYPSALITCFSLSATWIASRGANRNRVHLDCSAGIILFTWLQISANLVLFVYFSITALKENEGY